MSLHLRSRKFPSPAAYVHTVRTLARLHTRAHGRAPPELPGPEVNVWHLPKFLGPQEV